MEKGREMERGKREWADEGEEREARRGKTEREKEESATVDRFTQKEEPRLVCLICAFIRS